ncbi:MAG: hypothetical protein ACK47B_28075 [Armatimonadota bacterium]
MSIPLRHQLTRRAWLLAPLVAAVGLACAPIHGSAASAPAVWACGESLKVKPELAPQERNSVWDAATGAITLHGARGEYVGFQVVPCAGNSPLEQVEVRISALRGPGGAALAAENIDRFRQHYLKVTVPSEFEKGHPVPESAAGEFPVQMVPLREGKPGQTFSVPAGRNQPVWIDLFIPEGQAPGDYAGEVEVVAAGQPLAKLPLRLTVWRFTLPRETHLKTFIPAGPELLQWAFGLDRGDEAGLAALEDRFFQMAHQHRLNFQPSADDDLAAEWGGRYPKYLDGSAFKTRAGIGAGQNLLVTGTGEGETKAEVVAHVRRAYDWWKALPKKPDLVCYVYDEPSDDEEFKIAAERARWIREALGPELPLLVATTQPRRLPPGLINAWGELPAPEVAPRQAAGERIWATNFGYAGGPYVDTPGYAGRSQGWMAWKMKLDAWHFWDSCYWVDRQNLRGPDGKRIATRTIWENPAKYLLDTWKEPLTYDQFRDPKQKYAIRINGDGVLFYPGTGVGLQEPIAGFTMKSLRRGLQDYEYLWLLAKAGKPADDVVNRVTPKPNEWARDPDAWDAARLELGRRLDALAE